MRDLEEKLAELTIKIQKLSEEVATLTAEVKALQLANKRNAAAMAAARRMIPMR